MDSPQAQQSKWSWRTNPKRFVLTLVVVTVLALVVGSVGGWLVNQATAAPAVAPAAAQHRVVARCFEMDGQTCPAPTARDRRAALRWRAGRIHHASGFRPGVVFANPAVARRIWVRKITRTLRNARPLISPRDGERQAYALYAQMLRDAGCVDRGQPTYPINPGTCKYPNNSRPFTKDQIQTGGTAILCGGTVAIGVASMSATVGTTVFIAAWGATSCGWAFWSAID